MLATECLGRNSRAPPGRKVAQQRPGWAGLEPPSRITLAFSCQESMQSTPRVVTLGGLSHRNWGLRCVSSVGVNNKIFPFKTKSCSSLEKTSDFKANLLSQPKLLSTLKMGFQDAKIAFIIYKKKNHITAALPSQCFEGRKS